MSKPKTSWIYKRQKLERPPRQVGLASFASSNSFLDSAPMTRSVNKSPDAEVILGNSLTELQRLLNDHPLDILAGLYFYFLSLTFDEWGNKNSFLHADLEIIQGLTLLSAWPNNFLLSQTKRSEPTRRIKDLESRCLDLQPVVEQVKIVRDAFMAYNEYLLCSKNEIAEITHSGTAELQFQARLRTLFTRNWASPSRMKEVGRRLFRQFDSSFVNGYQLSAAQIIHLFEYIEESICKQMDAHLQLKRKILAAKSIKKSISIYASSLPDMELATLQDYAEKSTSKKNVINLLYMESDLFIAHSFKIDLNQLKTHFPSLSDGAIQKLLEAISLQPGELEGLNPLHLLLTNPIWTRPVIHVDGNFYIPGLHIPSAFLFPILERLLYSTTPAMKAAYEKYRAEFLETEAMKALVESFPNSKVFRNLHWYDPKQGETDVLLIHQNFYLIVEAKSSQASDSAKRGGESVEQMMKKIVHVASQQGRRLELLLKSETGQIELLTETKDKIKIAVEPGRQVVRIALNLDPLVAGLTDLAVSIDSATNPSIAMGLSDFQLILECLNSTSERAYYFFARNIFQSNFRFAGDELDLLGIYVSYGFDWANYQKNAFLNFVGASRFVTDPISQHRNRKPSKRLITTWWQDCIAYSEKDEDLKTIDTQLALWDISFEMQQTIERARIATAKQIHRADSSDPLVFLLPTVIFAAPAMIVGLVYLNAKEQPVTAMLEDVSSKMLESTASDYVLAISFDLKSGSYPYESITFTKRQSP